MSSQFESLRKHFVAVVDTGDIDADARKLEQALLRLVAQRRAVA